MFKSFARGYPLKIEEEEWLSSLFGETPTSSYFGEDAITETVYLAFLEDHDARRRQVHSNQSFDK
jgi:hypothetical protein